jgi:ribose/xylose/arabinose/galactoside ABC-type transport system permease subunit
MTKLVEDVGEGGGPVVTQVEERVSDSGGGVVFDAFGRFGLVALLALLVVAFSVLEPASFATADNYRSILDGQTPVVLLAMAALLPLVMGHFDLSVAANLGFAQVLVVGLIGYQDVPVAVAIPFALAASALVGLINGLLVVRLHLGSFIATLASGSILGGVQLHPDRPWIPVGCAEPGRPHRHHHPGAVDVAYPFPGRQEDVRRRCE